MQVGKYQLIRELAVGGMAEVFLARTAGPMGFEKLLVLKRVLPIWAREPAFIQMFFSEATLAARLTHPNIVQIFDFGESDGTYYLAMEYIDGPSLRALLDGSLRLGQPLPPVLCARMIAAACEGLAFAHDFRDPLSGQPLDIVHRDISPDNLLLSRQGTVKVVDFGIAKAAGQRHKTQTGLIKGKLAYMPPEQIRNETLDRQVDVYALGVVLYELVTGRRPFDAPTDATLMHAILYEQATPAVQLQPELPAPVQRILERAIAKERAQRYPDCLAFQADLEEFILSTGKPVTTQHVAQLIAQVSPPLPDAPPPPPPLGDVPLTATAIRAAPSRKVLGLRAGILGVALITVGAGALLWKGGGPSQPALMPPVAPSPPPPVPAIAAPTPAPAPAPQPIQPVDPPRDASAQQPAGDASPTLKTVESGVIGFDVKPSAIIFLDGKRVGSSSKVGSLDINPGTYTLEFVNKKLRKAVRRKVEVKAGQTVFLEVDLRHDEAREP